MKKQYKNQPGQAKKTEPIPSVNLQEKKPSFGTTFLKKYWPFLLIAASFLMLTTPNLGKFYTTDESVWLFGRVPTYWDALEDGKLENTYICNKPGVTTAIFTGPVYAWQSPNKSLILGTQSTYLFLWRFSQILFVLLVLWLCFYRLQQDYGSWLASVFVGLTAFYPVILGMARVVNPD
ncbi:MAG: hypothetical protein RIS47_2219, partial [Bacteroidota bacterium]